MQELRQEAGAHAPGHMERHAALWLLASLAGLHRRPFDAALVAQQFPPPLDLATLIEALQALGLNAGLVPWPADGLSVLPLPAVALLQSPPEPTEQPPTSPNRHEAAPKLTPALILHHTDTTLAWVQPGQTEPQTLPQDAARAKAAAQLLLVAPAEPPLTESSSRSASRGDDTSAKPFGFAWFVPELLRHRTIWRDILLASLGIQLVGLATPLFTQVIIDKVTHTTARAR